MQKNIFILFVILILSFVIPFYSVSVLQSFAYDEAIYIYNAFLETIGQHVYVDYFNAIQKPPGTVWFATPFVYFFGNSFETLLYIRLTCVLIKVVATFGIYVLSLKIVGNKDAALFAALSFAVSPVVNCGAAVLHSTNFVVLFSILAAICIVSKFRGNLFLAGLLVGFSCIFRQTRIIYLGVFLLFLQIQSNKIFLKSHLYAILGFSLGILPLFTYLLWTNSFDAFYSSVITFNKFHPAEEITFIGRLKVLSSAYMFELQVLLLVILGLISRHIKLDKVNILLILWITIFVVLFTFSKGLFEHYLSEIAVPMSVLAGITWIHCGNIMRRGIIVLTLFSVFFSILFPISIRNSSGAQIFHIIESEMPDSIITDSPEILFLMKKERGLFLGDSQENAYQEAGLTKFFGQRQKIDQEYLKGKDLIYLSRTNVPIPQEFTKICIMKQGRSLRDFLLELVSSGNIISALRQGLSTTANVCQHELYLNSSKHS